ncbi:MAG: hypothetical protein IPL35_14085 [Sphingobacteriales bacterium]|nr:hypothetical protein [Sphingobacteriales bacterium]
MAIRIIIISSLLLLASCFKDSDCHEHYQVALPFSTEGIPDTLAVGDTLWFNADFSDTLPDVINIGEKWHMHDFNFKGYFFLFKIDTALVNDINLEMEHIVALGKINPFYFNDGGVSYNFQFDFSETEHRYRLRFGVIPKQKGVYHFFMGSMVSDDHYRDRYNIDEECRYKQQFIISYSTNNRGDNNRHLFLASPDSAYVHSIDNLKLLDYWETGSYCFAVK